VNKKFLQLILLLLILNVTSIYAAKTGIEEGNEVIDFSITDLNGNKYSNTDLLGKTVILHFWASWCPPCKEELPVYNEFITKNKDKDIEFITVSVDNTERALLSFLEGRDVDFNIFHDKKGLARKFLVRAIPTTYIINEEGIIVKKKLGSIRWNQYSYDEIVSGEF
jgi:thiol-disulfide isomerase/thioredoxin